MSSFYKREKSDGDYATELLTKVTDVDRIKITTYLGRLAKQLILGSRRVTELVKPSEHYMRFVCDGDLDRDKFVSSVNLKHRSNLTLQVTANTDGDYVQAIFYDGLLYKDVGDIEFDELRESIKKIGLGQETAVMELWYIASTIFHLMGSRQIPAATIVPFLNFNVPVLSRTPTSLMVFTICGIVEYRIIN